MSIPTGAPAGEWRLIPGERHFYASADGRIYEAPHVRLTGRGARSRDGGVVEGSTQHGGPVVCLPSKAPRKVSRCVLLAFRGEPPAPDCVAAHLDGDKANNAISNLAWMTPKEFVALQTRLGQRRYLSGPDHPNHGRPGRGAKPGSKQRQPGGDVPPWRRAEAAWAAVRDIRERYAAGETLRALAAKHGIGYEAARMIANGETWREPAA